MKDEVVVPDKLAVCGQMSFGGGLAVRIICSSATMVRAKDSVSMHQQFSVPAAFHAPNNQTGQDNGDHALFHPENEPVPFSQPHF